ncbi:MAG: RNA polymerase sigma factor [Acidobacteriaceae bacterium]|nr:RNA polymerase sigma factor [Acidobacteriaceae bacterium]MBV9780243.1 RNA polymerase sigma factor [Acidobacteriaceae bacterium]
MSRENSERANLPQQAMILPSKSTPDASMRTTSRQICEPELKERVSALYETHRDRIYCFLVRKGLNATIAQEVTQDVFVDLLLTLKNGKRIDSEQRWLYAVAERTALDHWRRERYRMRVDFDSDLSTAADIPSSEPTPEAQAEHKQRLTRMAAGLQNLSNKQRLCIRLRAQGLRYREIAGVLRISTSTVAEWITSAIGRLQEHTASKSTLTGTLPKI